MEKLAFELHLLSSDYIGAFAFKNAHAINSVSAAAVALSQKNCNAERPVSSSMTREQYRRHAHLCTIICVARTSHPHMHVAIANLQCVRSSHELMASHIICHRINFMSVNNNRRCLASRFLALTLILQLHIYRLLQLVSYCRQLSIPLISHFSDGATVLPQ